MARLGNREARQELTFMTNAGVGSDEVFAITALAACDDRLFTDTFRYKLANATHLETRLAAARGLGRLGLDDGYETALRAVTSERTLMNDPGDTPDSQRLRAKQMACSALGAIGRADALPALERLLERSDDPRVEVSAAGAVLQILQTQKTKNAALPFAPRATQKR
jgi:HEAT repeat protein